jgi:tetratricopeptide (TPR) repeat protein
MNPAPARLTPPDYATGSSNPVLNETYLSSQADFHFTMGETLSFEGQSPRAIEEYKSTLIYDPKSVAVRLRLGQEYMRMGMMTEASEQAEIAVDMAPDNVEARMFLGGLYMTLKLFDQAREQFAAILAKNPGHTEAAVYSGALLAEQQKYDESVKYFEALSKNKDFKEPEKAYYYIGRVRSEQGAEHYADAKKAFHQALVKKPEYPEAVLALASLERANKKEKEMEQLLVSYQEKFGPEREMARQLSHLYLEREDYDKALEQLEALDGFERDNLNIKMQIALILIEQRKYETAAQRLEDVLQQAPESDKVRYYLGAVYEELNKPTLAVDHYSKIPAGSSYFAEAVVHSAHLLKTNGQMDAAIALIEKALKAQDDVPQIYAFYATLLDETRQFKKAVKMLAAAVERFPTNTQLRFFYGTMQDRVGNSAETIVQMAKVLEQDKDHVQALNYLAYTYADMGKNLDDAMTLATRALELQPGDGYILDTVGWIHFKRGETETAIKYLEAAVKARPDESIIAEHLGDAYIRNQMWQKAQRLYQKAVSMEADGTRSQKIQDKLANIQSQVQGSNRSPASQ